MSNLTDKDLIDMIMRGGSISLTYPNVSIGFIVISQYELDKLGLEVVVNGVKQSRIFAVDASFTEIARSIKEFAEEAGNAPPLESVIDLLESTLDGDQHRVALTRCIEEDLLSNLAYSINVSNEKELAYLLKQATEKLMFMDIGTTYPDKRVTFRVGMHNLDALFIEYSLYLGNEKITGLMKVPIKRYTKLSSLEYMDILNEVTAKFHNMRYARELDHLFRKWFVVYKDLVNGKCK